MKNKFLLMIVAVAVLFTTACVKTEVSDEVKELRKEQLKQAQAKTAKDLLAVANDELMLQIAKEKNEVTVQQNLVALETAKANLAKAEADGKLALAKVEKELAKAGNAVAEEYAKAYNKAMFSTSDPKGVVKLKEDLLDYQEALLNLETKIATLKEGGDLGAIKNENVMNAEIALKERETELEGLQKALEELKAISQDKDQAIAAYKQAKADSAAAVYAFNEANNKITLIENEKKVLLKQQEVANDLITAQEARVNALKKFDDDVKIQENFIKGYQAAITAADTTTAATNYHTAKQALAAAKTAYSTAKADSITKKGAVDAKIAEMDAAGFTTAKDANGFYPTVKTDYNAADQALADFNALVDAYIPLKTAYDAAVTATANALADIATKQSARDTAETAYEDALKVVKNNKDLIADAQEEIERLKQEKVLAEANVALYKELYDKYKANEVKLKEEINKKTAEVTSQEGEVKVLEVKKDNASDLAVMLFTAIDANAGALVGQITEKEKEIEKKETEVEKAKVELLKAKKIADNGSLSAEDLVKTFEAQKAAQEKKIADQESAVNAQQKIADAWYQKLTEALK